MFSLRYVLVQSLQSKTWSLIFLILCRGMIEALALSIPCRMVGFPLCIPGGIPIDNDIVNSFEEYDMRKTMVN